MNREEFIQGLRRNSRTLDISLYLADKTTEHIEPRTLIGLAEGDSDEAIEAYFESGVNRAYDEDAE